MSGFTPKDNDRVTADEVRYYADNPPSILNKADKMETSGNILISFHSSGNMKVDYNGTAKTPFGLSNVDLLRAMMATEGMMIAQTGLSIAEVRELLDDERAISVAQEQADGVVSDVEESKN